MHSYVLRRLALLVPTLAGISVAVFLMIHLVPGDPAQAMLGERANAETLTALRQEMGLDQPLYIQFGHFVVDLLSGDLGRSFRTHEKVTTEVFRRFPATCELTLAAMLFAIVGGLGLGLVAAVRRGTTIDYLSMGVATAGISMPVFWLALVLILLLAVKFPLFPISGRLSSGIFLESRTGFYMIDALLAGDLHAFRDAISHLALPAVALGTIPLAVIARMTRSSLLEVLGEDYIRTAWAKGLPQRLVLLRHAVRNAFIPTLTVIALEFGYLLGGAIITETIFAWPGIGRWLFLAVLSRDFRAVQGGVLLLATLFILINLLADILYAWLDPRIRYDDRS
ncbi:MAG: ABC transporter permease [Gemmatimonadetes bacterium]|nr:ABC transporter permease [Gemmatimonadota bacterium]MBT6147962.1 ABC transporter permease [Gemmatimonadota bacterium]MBT7862105.1 ABC transporter permease [Gemmatimonadota bacterium]